MHKIRQHSVQKSNWRLLIHFTVLRLCLKMDNLSGVAWISLPDLCVLAIYIGHGGLGPHIRGVSADSLILQGCKSVENPSKASTFSNMLHLWFWNAAHHFFILGLRDCFKRTKDVQHETSRLNHLHDCANQAWWSMLVVVAHTPFSSWVSFWKSPTTAAYTTFIGDKRVWYQQSLQYTYIYTHHLKNCTNSV